MTSNNVAVAHDQNNLHQHSTNLSSLELHQSSTQQSSQQMPLSSNLPTENSNYMLNNGEYSRITYSSDPNYHVGGNYNHGSNVNNNSNNFWSVADSEASHKWCAPVKRTVDKVLEGSQSTEASYGGGGRLKVKSSIGGVSVQDLSSAVIQSE